MLFNENYSFIIKAEVWLDEQVEMLYNRNNNAPSNICGASYKDRIIIFEKTILHNTSLLTLKACSELDGYYLDEYLLFILQIK